MLYLPETRESGAFTLIDRIHERFRKVADAMTGLDTTFSSGIVETPRDSVDLDLLCRRAGEAAQHAKAEGRGRIVLWGKELGQGARPPVPEEARAARPFDI